jgi:transcriptional regulator with XRE-family HTH domain
VKRVGKNAQTDRERDFARGAYLFRVTEDILVAMEDQGVSKAELAQRLGKSKARISQLLGGSSNMTIGTLAEIAFALGLTPDKTFTEYSNRRYRIVDRPGEDGSDVGADGASATRSGSNRKASVRRTA